MEYKELFVEIYMGLIAILISFTYFRIFKNVIISILAYSRHLDILRNPYKVLFIKAIKYAILLLLGFKWIYKVLYDPYNILYVICLFICDYIFANIAEKLVFANGQNQESYVKSASPIRIKPRHIKITKDRMFDKNIANYIINKNISLNNPINVFQLINTMYYLESSIKDEKYFFGEFHTSNAGPVIPEISIIYSSKYGTMPITKKFECEEILIPHKKTIDKLIKELKGIDPKDLQQMITFKDTAFNYAKSQNMDIIPKALIKKQGISELYSLN